MATSNNPPLAVMEYNFLKKYVTNKDEIIKKFNITNDAEWKKIYCEKLDLSKVRMRITITSNLSISQSEMPMSLLTINSLMPSSN